MMVSIEYVNLIEKTGRCPYYLIIHYPIYENRAKSEKLKIIENRSLINRFMNFYARN